ncbi:MAG: autotransporter domain-containing protein [Alphaproteobacteria bacterium]|nr:autotransporter domain-containing protein [Alphaproteobacteria bacterium]
MRILKIFPVIAVAFAAVAAQAAVRVEVNYGETETISAGVSGLEYYGPNGGGMLANYSGDVIIASGLMFSGNKADAGGAIYNAPDSTIINPPYPPAGLSIGDNVIFSRNVAVVDAGGAIYMMGYDEPSTLVMQNRVSFLNNSSLYGWGGALYLQDATTVIGDFAAFRGNTAGTHGGAIFNWNYQADLGSATLGTNSSFINNSAAVNGGAVANYYSQMSFGAGANFSGNSAKGLGGAIYNSENSTMTFGGSAAFSNNSAGLAANDIYNAGTLIFSSGTVTLDGGIAGPAGSVLQFGNNVVLNARLGSAPTIQADSIQVGSGSVINNLTIGIGVLGDNIKLFDAGTMTGSFNYTGSNFLYDVTQNLDGSFNVAQRTSIAGVDPNELAVLNGITTGLSSNAQFNAIANGISALAQSGKPIDIAAALAAAGELAPSPAPQSQVVSTQTALVVIDAVGTRFSGGSAPAFGMSSGDLDVGGGAVWAQGVASNARLRGEGGFDSESIGGAVGVEVNVTSSSKIGAGYAYTSTDVNPSVGKIDVRSNTVFAYAEYKPRSLFFNGVVSYTFGDYSDEKNILGVEVTSTHRANAIAAQGLFGYEVDNAKLIVTPQAGVRYINARREAYKDSAGSQIEAGSSEFLTGIVGIKFAYDQLGNFHRYGGSVPGGSRVIPEVYIGATYDAVTSNSDAALVLANGSVVDIAGSALPRTALEAGVGFNVISGSIDLNISYMGRFRENYTDNTGMLSFKYRF